MLYAEHICLFAFGKDPVLETVEKLNCDLVKIGLWAEIWKVLFNAKKSKDMIFMKSKANQLSRSGMPKTETTSQVGS